MSWFLGKRADNTSQQQPATSVRVQTSIYGKPIPFGYGRCRIPVNLIFQDNFSTYPPTVAGGGGKNTSGFGNAGNTQGAYTYSIYCNMALCEGPVSLTETPSRVWWNKASADFGRAQTQFPLIGIVQGYFGFNYLRGTYSQSPVSATFGYRGICYVGSFPMYLGTSAEYPNITIDVVFNFNRAISISWGAHPRDVIADFLTNDFYGVGFPAERFPDQPTYSDFCRATGLVLSPFVADQRAASEWMAEWATATNSEYVWSGGQLKIVTYGDEQISGNGATYNPPAVTSYVVQSGDYIVSGGNPNEPIIVHRKRMEDVINKISVEYLDGENGANNYDPALIDAKDDALIEMFGLRPKSTVQLHAIQEKAAATLSAHFMLGREQVLNTYTFTLPHQFILLDPMDIITINDPVLGIANLQVRIKEITENDDHTLTFIAEDYLPGAARAAAVASEPLAGNAPNYNVDPGNVLTPLIFEPTDALAGGLEIWGAVTGADMTVWGGCEVWSSADGVTFIKEGTIQGQSRMGHITTSLPAVTDAAVGLTFDNIHTLGVDLTDSVSTLSSVSHDDLIALSTLSYLDGNPGEFIAYQNVTPTGTYTANLTALVRGAYGSTIQTFAINTRYCRIDNGIFKVPFTADRIGQTIYFKFLSFNKYGGGRQGLADVGPYSYNVKGTALASPLPDVTSFTSVYAANITQLSWTEITDFRTGILYEIRKGTDWDSASSLGRFAHPPVPALGDGVYWIKAFCNPVTGLNVYSENANDIFIAGSVIPLNSKATWDEILSGAQGMYGDDTT